MPQLHSSEPQWFAVSTRSKSEKLVQRLLQQQGINAYVPLQKVQRQYPGGQKRVVQLPLITCYVFVKIVRQEYTKVLQTDHVIKFIRLSNELHAIPEEEIRVLRQVTGEEQIPVNAVPFQYRPGEKVEISYGPLTGTKAKLVDIKGQRQVVIELENVGYTLEVSIHPRHIRPAWMKV